MKVIEFGLLGDGLAVGHAGCAGGDLGRVFALHALDVDLEVQLAHAGDDGLVGFRVDMGFEGRVLFRETVEGLGHVDFGLVVLRADC